MSFHRMCCCGDEPDVGCEFCNPTQLCYDGQVTLRDFVFGCGETYNIRFAQNVQSPCRWDYHFLNNQCFSDPCYDGCVMPWCGRIRCDPNHPSGVDHWIIQMFASRSGGGSGACAFVDTVFSRPVAPGEVQPPEGDYLHDVLLSRPYDSFSNTGGVGGKVRLTAPLECEDDPGGQCDGIERPCDACPPTLTMTASNFQNTINDCWFDLAAVGVECQGDATLWDNPTPGFGFGDTCPLEDNNVNCVDAFPQHGQVVGSIRCEGTEWVAAMVILHAHFPYGPMQVPGCQNVSMELEWRQPLGPTDACPPSDNWDLVFAQLGNLNGVWTHDDGLSARLQVA